MNSSNSSWLSLDLSACFAMVDFKHKVNAAMTRSDAYMILCSG